EGRGLPRGLKERQRFEQPLRPKPAAVGDEGLLALEMRTRLKLPQHLLDMDASRLRRGDAGELREMAPKRRERNRRLGSRCGKSCELAKRLLRFTAADLVHKGLDRDLGAVADDRIDVLRSDASVAAREQR